MGEWSDREAELGLVDWEGNILINDEEPDAVEVKLTPSKYLSPEGRYLRAKLTNNELENADVNLEVLHDKSNDSDPLALEVFCNRISIGYIQKYSSEVDIDDFCFFDNSNKRKLSLEWREDRFLLSGKILGISNKQNENWIYRLWKWADEYDIETETIPREKLGLINLKSLDISDHSETISSIPREIGNLTELRYLKILCQGVETLPKEIGNLTLLKILDLYRSKFTSLPRDIGRLIHLESLCLEGNKLTTLPKEIGNLKNLRELMLADNKLECLPREIGNLEQLDFINLKGNRDLTEIPEEVANLKQLRGLNLKDTGVDWIPEAIENLPNLVRYSEYRTEMTFLPRDKPKFGFGHGT